MTKSGNWVEHLGETDGSRIHLVGNDRGAMADVLNSAVEGDYRVFRLNLSGVHSKSELLEKIASKLNFPDYFGGNWDALLDMLSDLSWWEGQHGFLLLVEGSRELLTELPDDFSVLFEIILDAIERMRGAGKSMHAVIVDGGALRFGLETAVGVMTLCDHSPL